MSKQALKPCPICGDSVYVLGKALNNALIKTVTCQNPKCWFVCQLEHWNTLPRQCSLTELQEGWMEFGKAHGLIDNRVNIEVTTEWTEISYGEEIYISAIRKPKEPIWKVEVFDYNVTVYKDNNCLGSVDKQIYDAILSDQAAKLDEKESSNE